MVFIKQFLCEHCGQETFQQAMVHLTEGTSNQKICRDCFSKIMAKQLGVPFSPIQNNRITLSDFEGKGHTFEIASLLTPNGMALEATEWIDENGEKTVGYKESVLMPVGTAQEIIYEKLMAKLVRVLAEPSLSFNYGLPAFVYPGTVRGRVEYEESPHAEGPKVVIDGRTFTWDEFGKMMSSWEGWKFQLRMIDITEDE
ncbi:hypothetical protein H1S01_12550 [Heliobacterium chlorum]|uniref:DUF4428 domain-containing protein n=1 Tax=Heliobacterium chlorum TaxID=2698 RepID=A0ABR7T3K8_HELCL|nr:hypothetical protein [Heliobacterium chlorum]MBC9785339.1 hypothetical protein [Heliobacterium chlorum]